LETRVKANMVFTLKAPIPGVPIDLPRYPEKGQTFSIRDPRKSYDCAESSELTNFKNPEFYQKRYFEIVRVYPSDISTEPIEIDCEEIQVDEDTMSQI
jgi:hypothetical protein